MRPSDNNNDHCRQTSQHTRRKWFAAAVVHTLIGLMLGLITSFAVLWLSYKTFPKVAEFGTDLGLQLEMAVTRLRHFPGTLPSADGPRFVFVDVDPERVDGAMPPRDACEALASAPCSETGLCNAIAPEPLRCSASRPVNRYLLAHLIDGLRKRQASLIVLDVALASQDDVVSDSETAYLKDQLARQEPGIAPVIYAAPVDIVWDEGDARSGSSVQVESPGSGARYPYPGSIDDDSVQQGRHNAIAAVAFPAADTVVRRYPKCLRIHQTDKTRLSLPYLAAHYAGGPDEECSDTTTSAPRIIYDLPHLRDHEDWIDHERGNSAFYRQVYARCLASNFWNNDSACGAEGDHSLYRQRIVVIGASNPVRRDWHYTPIGNLVGAEVVINATRSALLYPHNHDHTFIEIFFHEVWIVLLCSTVWFGFHALRFATKQRSAAAVTIRSAGIRRALFVSSLFVVSLIVSLALALWLSYKTDGPAPSLNVLIGVLAISLEQYVDAMAWLIRRVEHALGNLLGIEH